MCGHLAEMARLLLVVVLLALASCYKGQQVPQSTPQPVRSYAQAAQNNQQGSTTGQRHHNNAPAVQEPSSGGLLTGQPAPSYAQAANQGVTPPPRSYSQAANNNPTHQGVNTPPPRSYAQAANNHNQRPPQGNHNQRPSFSTTPRPQGGHQPQRGTPTRSPAAANVTDDDLRTLSDELLRSDANNVGSTVRANWQGRTHGSNQADLAPAPLLNVPPRALQSPTVSKLRLLYDNYVADSALAESVTPAERDENTALLDAIVATQVMSKTRRFLTDKGLLPNAPGSLRTLLQQLWFTLYPRLGGRAEVGSSAFEHVFLAELRHGEVSGLHNWVFFAAEENSGKADYLGYIRRIDLGGRGSVVKHHFRWANVTKPVGSMFVGTSPELEMALYTVCFLARPDDRCPVRLAGEPFFIKTHSFTYRGNKYIGSAFPDI